MRLRSVLCTAILTAALLAAAALANAQEVAEGKCLTYDKAGKTLSIDEYNTDFSKENPYGKSTGVEAVFDLSGAKVGLEPEPGNILRIAYLTQGDKKLAVKVMNVTKQDLKK